VKTYCSSSFNLLSASLHWIVNCNATNLVLLRRRDGAAMSSASIKCVRTLKPEILTNEIHRSKRHFLDDGEQPIDDM
jgi:hypothetical protein